MIGIARKKSRVSCELQDRNRRPPVPFLKSHTVVQKIHGMLVRVDFALSGSLFEEKQSNFLSTQHVRKNGTGGMWWHLSSLQSIGA